MKTFEEIREAPEVAQDPDIKGRKGTQPAVYHAGLSKGTKQKRDRQFKKQAKMSDSNPAAYKDAPSTRAAAPLSSIFLSMIFPFIIKKS